MTPGETVASVEIQSIATGGDGVARVDGQVVFVPRAAPGDRARIRFVSGRRFARAELIEIENPSPLRVDPLCQHYVGDQCGGCQLQHLAGDAQLKAKVGIVRDTMTRIARRSIDQVPIEASDNVWRYRRKLTLTLRRTPAGWIAGLHRLDEPDRVFPLRECPITADAVVDMWRAILAAAETFPAVDSLRGSVQTEEDGFSLVLQGQGEWDGARALQAAVPALREIWWASAGKRPRRLTAGPESDDRAVGASFAQVNPEVGARLHRYVVERARSYHPATVVDAYAGSGATALPLAEQGVRVTAIEVDRAAVRLASSRLPAGSRALAGRAEILLPKALPADVVLLNPPRTGAALPVTVALEAARPRPRAIIYVSCDPATLARDVARLPSYRVAAIQCFDMFPQTAHVETVCELVPVA